jgi:putative membrane-bound dehydrogenase-like protein
MLVRLCSIALLFGCVKASAALPQPPPDWKIEVVAASPDVQHPSVVCVAPDGRVFVAEDPMDIRLPANSANGRILCFHPDGRRTVFAEKLYAVFGMQYLEGKLYVLHNPKFTVFHDDNGVGKEPFNLIESTHPNPWALDWNDHVPANFKLAMDGYFYIAVGDKGLYGAVGSDGKRVGLHGGGIVRMRPDGTGLEVFCTGVRNILDVAINAEDEIFTYDNTDEHEWMGRLTHMVDGGFYGYPFDFIPRRNYTLWMMGDLGGGAATGTLCYNEDGLPPEYHGNLFLADFGKRQILRVRLEREGATFRVKSKEDFFRDPPEDFRPVGIAFSTDGLGIYICDWQHRDIKADVRVGRLLKVTYQGQSQARARPKWYLDAASGRKVDAPKQDIVSALSHPSHGVRLTAQRLLKPQDVAGLTNAHAPWIAPEMASKALESPDPNLRRQALRVLASRGSGSIEARLADKDPSVRFHAATAIGRIGDESAVPALLRVADDPDVWVRYAISKALNRIGAWEPMVRALQDRARREVAFNALRETYDAALLNALIQIAPNDEAAVRLVTLIHRKRPEWKGEWWAYHPFRLTPPAKSVEWEGTERAVDFIFGALTNTDAAVRVAAIEGVGETKDKRAVPILSTMLHGPVLGAVLAALKSIGGQEAQQTIIAYLKKPSGAETNLQQALAFLEVHPANGTGDLLAHYIAHDSESVRTAALNALVKCEGESAMQTIAPLLKDGKLPVRVSAVLALGKLKSDAAMRLLLDAAQEPELREACVTAVAQTPTVHALDLYLDGLASPNLKVREGARKAISTIRDAAWPHLKERAASIRQEVRKELLSIYKRNPEPQQLFATSEPESPERYLKFALSQKGSVAAGRQIFFNSAGVACSQCHVVRNEGGRVGPDLTTAGTQFSRRELAESILFPSKAVREGYAAITVETKDGESFSGLLKGETAEEVQLVDSVGQLHRIPKPRISSRQSSALSLMPEGLHTALTLEQFADLLAYLESLK